MIKLKFYGYRFFILTLFSICMLRIFTRLNTIDIIIISSLSITLFLASYIYIIKNVLFTKNKIRLESDEFIIKKTPASYRRNFLFNPLGILYKTNRKYIFIKLPLLEKKETRFYINEINKIDFINIPLKKARLELSSAGKKNVFYVADYI